MRRRLDATLLVFALAAGCGASNALPACNVVPASTALPAGGPAAAAEPTPAYPDPRTHYPEPDEYKNRPVSVEAGEFYFNEAGVGDPYGAGIAYPAFLAMMRRFPEELGKNWREFNRKFGTIPNVEAPDDPWALPVGFHLARDPDTRVPFLMMNCRICHAARVTTPAGTRVVDGMGSKQVRIHAYDGALMRIAERTEFTVDELVQASGRLARKLDVPWPHNTRRVILKETILGFKRRAEARARDVARVGDGLPGRVATIEGFMMALNHQSHATLEIPKEIGWAKIPDVATWRYRITNSFDAVATGSPVALVAEADFAFGVRTQWYDTHRHIATSMYLYLKAFDRHLPFPAAIDLSLAKTGKDLFDANCSSCHGTYAAPDAPERTVVYEEKVVPRKVIGTDPVRLDVVTPEFIRVANSEAATRGLVLVRATNGYVPRPLVGVWARGLYGHNGQWPDLATIALPPEKRPRHYVVSPASPFNLDRVGTRWRAITISDGKPMVDAAEGNGLVPLVLGPSEYVYDASRPGFDAGGHEFLSRLVDSERRSIIEYLKTL